MVEKSTEPKKCQKCGSEMSREVLYITDGVAAHSDRFSLSIRIIGYMCTNQDCKEAIADPKIIYDDKSRLMVIGTRGIEYHIELTIPYEEARTALIQCILDNGVGSAWDADFENFELDRKEDIEWIEKAGLIEDISGGDTHKARLLIPVDFLTNYNFAENEDETTEFSRVGKEIMKCLKETGFCKTIDGPHPLPF